ncbi:MAG TPA: lysylphosphatidylglycerol synthase transmembrane domain-containing protein [bacterium]|nr:lysylphosphatidylglycerol synthase transmembrane domain-containing protein [bacterium]
MQPKTKRRIANYVGILLSASFLYFCFRSLDAAALKRAFFLPHPVWLIGVVALNFVLMGQRALLWSALLKPLGSLPFWNLFDVLHIGYMANNLLPLKVGEFFRASFIAKKWNLPYARVLTTVGLERFFPGFTLIILLFLAASELKIPGWIMTGAYVLGGVLLGVLGMLIFVWLRKPDLSKWEKRHRILFRVIEFFDHIGEASQPLKSPTSFLWMTFLALAGWAMQVVMLRWVEAAFAVEISWLGSLFVLVAINFAISLPSAPGNLGTFELATVLAYTWLGLDKATALGIAFYFHFLQVIPVTLVGLFYYFRWGLRLKDMERTDDEAGDCHPEQSEGSATAQG